MDYSRLSMISNTTHDGMIHQSSADNMILGGIVALVIFTMLSITCCILFNYNKIKQHYYRNQDRYHWLLDCCCWLPCVVICNTDSTETSV